MASKRQQEFPLPKIHSSAKPSPKKRPKGIQQCMAMFLQESFTDEDEILKEIAGMEYEEELPNFDLGFNIR